MKFHEGQKVWFEREKRPYTVQCFNGRYVICTKPFNLMKTVQYTIIDLERNIRGTENLIFCMGFETKELCREALKRLEGYDDGTGYIKTEVSHRNYVPLDILTTHPQGE